MRFVTGNLVQYGFCCYTSELRLNCNFLGKVNALGLRNKCEKQRRPFAHDVMNLNFPSLNLCNTLVGAANLMSDMHIMRHEIIDFG